MSRVRIPEGALKVLFWQSASCWERAFFVSVSTTIFNKPLGKKTILELKTETITYEGLEKKVVDMIAEIETEYPLGMAVCGWAD